MKKKKNMKLRDQKPVKDPVGGGKHHHHGTKGTKERPEPPVGPGGILP
ncbi:MAG: hypothetical protein JWO45_725 [Spartobacteria bacterium]|nr:hypothetical protein [Spartobacteria bacterium]